MELKTTIRKMRKMFGNAVVNAELWIGIVGILGTLLGFWVKRWWVTQAAKAATEQRQKEEQATADAHEQAWADESAAKEKRKQSQDAKFNKWEDGVDTETMQ